MIELGNGWRVGNDPLQRILQRDQGGRWRDRSFCVTREALLRCIREHCGKVDVAMVLRLPEWHPDRAAAAVEAIATPPIPMDPLPALLPASIPASLPEGSYESDYPLEYYEDGYPKLPCLDRRRPKLSEAA